MPLIQRAGKESVLPEMAAAAVQPVDVLAIEPVSAADDSGQRMGLAGNDHEVDVIGHQAVGQDSQPMPRRLLGQQIEIGPSVVIDEEDILAIVAALDDVVGQAGKDDARDARHGRRVPRA